MNEADDPDYWMRIVHRLRNLAMEATALNHHIGTSQQLAHKLAQLADQIETDHLHR